jgi:hypothetical protein
MIEFLYFYIVCGLITTAIFFSVWGHKVTDDWILKESENLDISWLISNRVTLGIMVFALWWLVAFVILFKRRPS